MKHITILFTTIFFLAFVQEVVAVEIKPAFPSWVESVDDPPDCIVEGVSKMETCHYTVIGNNKIFIRQQPPAYQSSATTRINTTHNTFVYTPYVSAGGVGRLYSCKVRFNLATIQSILTSTSGGLSRIRG